MRQRGRATPASARRYGGRAALVVLSSAVLTASHLGLALSQLPAQFLLIGIGIGYATFASVIWPSIPSVIGRQQLGTAYGLVTTMQNIGLFVLPLLVGLVLDLGRRHHPAVDPNPCAPPTRSLAPSPVAEHFCARARHILPRTRRCLGPSLAALTYVPLISD